MIEVRPDVAPLFPEREVEAFLAIRDTVVRAKGGRSIGHFERGGRRFYIKKHRAAGWRAIADDLVRLRGPQIGARPEVEAIRACERLGIATLSVAAFGEAGCGPGQRSFIVTDEIVPNASLEDYCRDWATHPPPFKLKRKLIRAVADLARTMHAGGVNHRDFYLCHLLFDPATAAAPRLRLIDLHRAQVREATPRRWIVKDVAGLYFSAMDAGLTRRDLLRFVVCYGRARDAAFWRAVTRRARALYRKEFGREPGNAEP